jgi:hypothetical protein
MSGRRAKLIRAYVSSIWSVLSDEDREAWHHDVRRFYRHAKREWIRGNFRG